MLNKKLKLQLAAKNRHCAAQISCNNASNDQICFKIQPEANNKVACINKTFLTAQREMVTLKRENRLALDEDECSTRHHVESW